MLLELRLIVIGPAVAGEKRAMTCVKHVCIGTRPAACRSAVMTMGKRSGGGSIVCWRAPSWAYFFLVAANCPSKVSIWL